MRRAGCAPPTLSLWRAWPSVTSVLCARACARTCVGFFSCRFLASTSRKPPGYLCADEVGRRQRGAGRGRNGRPGAAPSAAYPVWWRYSFWSHFRPEKATS